MIKKILSILMLFVLIFLHGADIVYATTLTNNLIAYYKLDESSGTAADSTGNGWTLTNNNTTPYGTGKINNGVQPATTGSKDLSRTDSLGYTSNGNITVSLWAKIASFASESTPRQFLIHPLGSPYVGFNMTWDSTHWYVGRVKENSGTDFLAYTFTTSLDTWYMFTFTWDGTTLTMYKNGSSVASSTPSGNGASGDGRTVVGSNSNGGQFFNGTIDEIGVWTRALSAAEITELYNSGAGNQYPFGAGGSTPPAHDNDIILFE